MFTEGWRPDVHEVVLNIFFLQFVPVNNHPIHKKIKKLI